MKPDPVRERVDTLTALAWSVARLHAALLAGEDAVVGPLGLTGARRQVLGSIALATEASVPGIAAALGLSRQAIQKQVDLLLQDGLVAARPNPAHGRSPLFQLTGAGRAAFARAEQRWSSAAVHWTEGLPLVALRASARLLDQLTERLFAASQERDPP